MPEGDTIYRTADVLRRALLGRVVTRAIARPQPGLRSVPRMEAVVGATIERVEPRGKHVLIGFSNGLTLRTHLRMRGAWHRYRPGERWRLSDRRATVVIETAESVAVCFDAPVAELLTTAELRRHRSLTALGPDLLGDDFDADEAVRRLRERGTLEVGEALLDQRALAGIGNVIKSEACFMERVDPWRRVESLDETALRGLVERARRLLAANTGGGARVTTGTRTRGSALWVYGRAGRPCRRCGTRIAVRPQGELARLTYWCPRCQVMPGGDPDAERTGRAADPSLRPRPHHALRRIP